MSVIMMLELSGDPDAVERYAGEHPDEMRSIRDHAVEHGLIAHRFYGRPGGILVVDEWPDEESFLHFFSHVEGQVASMMEAVGVGGRPSPVFWRKLETHDEYGWD